MRRKDNSHREEPPSLLEELERRLSPEAFAEVRRALQGLAGHRYRIRHKDVVYPTELALTMKLLNEGRPRAEVKGILMERLQISKPKAYRLIEAALNNRKALPATRTNRAGLEQLAMAVAEGAVHE